MGTRPRTGGLGNVVWVGIGDEARGDGRGVGMGSGGDKVEGGEGTGEVKRHALSY